MFMIIPVRHLANRRTTQEAVSVRTRFTAMLNALQSVCRQQHFPDRAVTYEEDALGTDDDPSWRWLGPRYNKKFSWPFGMLKMGRKRPRSKPVFSFTCFKTLLLLSISKCIWNNKFPSWSQTGKHCKEWNINTNEEVFTRVLTKIMLKVSVMWMTMGGEHGPVLCAQGSRADPKAQYRVTTIWADICLAGCLSFLHLALHGRLVHVLCSSVTLPCLWPVGASAGTAW